MKQPLFSLIKHFFKSQSLRRYLTTKKLAIALFLIVCTSVVNAQIIKGKVYDAVTGEPLVGATVKIVNGDFNRSTSAKLDGSYIFKGLPVNSYQITVVYVGYKDSKPYDVTLKSPSDVVVQNILLENTSSELTEVVVSASGGKTSDQSARNLEKIAPSLENILSQNTIQLLPDVTVGNALQRVSGVIVQRTSTGEGRYAI